MAGFEPHRPRRTTKACLKKRRGRQYTGVQWHSSSLAQTRRSWQQRCGKHVGNHSPIASVQGRRLLQLRVFAVGSLVSLGLAKFLASSLVSKIASIIPAQGRQPSAEHGRDVRARRGGGWGFARLTMCHVVCTSHEFCVHGETHAGGDGQSWQGKGKGAFMGRPRPVLGACRPALSCHLQGAVLVCAFQVQYV